jgi:hypothetical protein
MEVEVSSHKLRENLKVDTVEGKAGIKVIQLRLP